MQRRTVVALLALALSAGSLMAAPADEQTPPQAQVTSQVTSQVSMDENGQLRAPTAEEQKLLEAAAAARFKAGTPLKVTTTSSGAVSIALDERFDHMYVATTDADGNVTFECVETPAEAYALLVAAQSKADTILRIRPAAKPAAERE